MIKIIKEFEDPEFAHNRYGDSKIKWSWGLGEDGQIYYNSSYYGRWIILSDMFPVKLSLRDMKRLVNAFDKYMIWL